MSAGERVARLLVVASLLGFAAPLGRYNPVVCFVATELTPAAPRGWGTFQGMR